MWAEKDFGSLVLNYTYTYTKLYKKSENFSAVDQLEARKLKQKK